MKFLLGYNMKIALYWGLGWNEPLEGKMKIWWWGVFQFLGWSWGARGGGGDEQIFGSLIRKTQVCMSMHVYVCIYVLYVGRSVGRSVVCILCRLVGRYVGRQAGRQGEREGWREGGREVWILELKLFNVFLSVPLNELFCCRS